jgi:hypothetical protein
MAGRGTAAVVSVITVVLLAGCGGLGGRGKPPPSPTETLEPIVVGLIAAAKPDYTNSSTGSVTLDDGSTIVLRNLASIQIPTNLGPLEPGDLVLAGPGSPPAWWANLAPKVRGVPSAGPRSSAVPGGACWLLTSGAFDGGHTIHFANGLLLKKAPGFRVVYDWIPDPFPTRDGDQFCVGRDGLVTSLDFIWEPI